MDLVGILIQSHLMENNQNEFYAGFRKMKMPLKTQFIIHGNKFPVIPKLLLSSITQEENYVLSKEVLIIKRYTQIQNIMVVILNQILLKRFQIHIFQMMK